VPISVDQIDLWRQVPTETEILEFKEAKNQFDNNKLYSYCVAIANEGGGHLILGIKNAPPRIVVGTKAFNNPAEMAGKLFTALGFRVDITEVEHPGGRVVVFQIPARPRGVAYSLEGAYLMRCGESLVPMSPDVLRKIFAEGEPDWLEEPTLARLGPGQVLVLLDTPSFFRLLDLPYPATTDGVLERLIAERLIDQQSGGSFSIRRIAGILLAKEIGIFPELARKAPRVIVYQGTSKLAPTIIERVAVMGYAVGFQRLVKFVSSYLPQNEVIKDALRKEMKLIPEIAIRELVANALIHQDFTISGGSVVIEIFSNRLEISNMGEPIVPVARFIDGYQSRNERLASIMRRMGICEERSSGIDKVVRTAEACQLPAPDFRAIGNRTLVTIYGPKPFDEMDRDDRVRACYQHCALKWVMKQRMTNQSLRERFHLPENKSAVVSQVIAAAIDAGQIVADEAVGPSRRFARYLPFWA
jgi:ATP-dependent DNA helicase RecG